MCPDTDATRSAARPPRGGPSRAADRLAACDVRVFEALAGRHWAAGDRLLPGVSRWADHGVLWFSVAACLTLTGSPRARRAAVRGVASLTLASAAVNTVGKRSVRRPRPVLDAVPVVRRLKRQPLTTSFPSGHAASAAAFAAGVAFESPVLGATVAPVAAAVGMSRVYTGVHYPSDVLAGAALGVGAAVVARRVAAVIGAARQERRAVPGGRRSRRGGRGVEDRG